MKPGRAPRLVPLPAAWLAAGCLSCAAPGPTARPLAHADSLRTVERVLEREAVGCDAEPSRCAHVRITWPEVVDAPGGDAGALVTAIRGFAARAYDARDAAGSPAATADSFMARHAAWRARGGGRTPPWELSIRVSMLDGPGGMVVLGAEVSRYEGGAHGLVETHLASLERSTARPVALDEVLVAGGRERLLVLAEGAFRARRELGATTPFEAEGLRFPGGRFALPRNWALTREGLRLVYNPYEVGSYSAGATEVVVPCGDLGGVVAAEYSPCRAPAE